MFDSCGEIYIQGECRMFFPYSPSLWVYLLPDTLRLPSDPECHVTGTVWNSWVECNGNPGYTTLLDVVIRPCEPEQLGCGVLTMFNDEYDCVTWAPLDRSSPPILVDGHAGFAPGDTAWASGIRADLADICICGCGVLLHTVLTACPDTLAPLQRTSWGKLKALYAK